MKRVMFVLLLALALFAASASVNSEAVPSAGTVVIVGTDDAAASMGDPGSGFPTCGDYCYWPGVMGWCWDPSCLSFHVAYCLQAWWGGPHRWVKVGFGIVEGTVETIGQTVAKTGAV